MVDFLLYAASLEASVATRSKMSNIISIPFVKKYCPWLTIDEGVENGHCAVGDTSIWVNLLQN